MLKFIMGLVYAGQRKFDVWLLWPICCEKAPDLDHAKAVFMVHVMDDPAWLTLGHREIIRRVDALEQP